MIEPHRVSERGQAHAARDVRTHDAHSVKHTQIGVLEIADIARYGKGWSLADFPWFTFASIGGQVATGSHGSGLAFGSLSDDAQLVALQMVLANGPRPAAAHAHPAAARIGAPPSPAAVPTMMMRGAAADDAHAPPHDFCKRCCALRAPRMLLWSARCRSVTHSSVISSVRSSSLARPSTIMIDAGGRSRWSRRCRLRRLTADRGARWHAGTMVQFTKYTHPFLWKAVQASANIID